MDVATIIAAEQGAKSTGIEPPRQRWVLAEAHPSEAAVLSKASDLPMVLAELLVARGVTRADDARAFLNPSIHDLHDPFLMKGMSEAVVRLEAAISRREPVLLYGDYDVDGATAVVLLKTAIEMLGGVAIFHIPHRLNEGYGLRSNIIERAHAEGVRLIITVDTGIRAFAEAETAHNLGMDLILTDHHLLAEGDAVPAAVAILNPNQPGCAYPEKELCGAAIALKLAQAVLSRRDAERMNTRLLPSFLKLAALATIADAVPLKGENRAIAAVGLKELCRPASAGLCALLAVAGLDPAAKPLTGYDVAFRIAPRVNAAGRMDVAADVIDLFVTRDKARAAELAEKLEQLNRERRETEAAALEAIKARLSTDYELAQSRLVVVDGEGWHRGVIGILASRVLEATAKPAIVISTEEGVAYGSGRSIEGFHLLSAIESCSDLFTRFGGHAFAVGFALPEERLPELKRRLALYAGAHLRDRVAERVLHIHAELALHEITGELVAMLDKLEPFGHGNPEPVFLARRVQLAEAPRLLKDKHVRMELIQTLPSGSPASGKRMRAVGWGMASRSAELGLFKGSLIDLAYRIRVNEHPRFGGIEAEIIGIEPSLA